MQGQISIPAPIIREKFTKYLAKGNELLQALRVYKDKNVSLVDAFIFSKAQYKDAEVFTLDKKLSKLTIA